MKTKDNPIGIIKCKNCNFMFFVSFGSIKKELLIKAGERFKINNFIDDWKERRYKLDEEVKIENFKKLLWECRYEALEDVCKTWADCPLCSFSNTIDEGIPDETLGEYPHYVYPTRACSKDKRVKLISNNIVCANCEEGVYIHEDCGRCFKECGVVFCKDNIILRDYPCKEYYKQTTKNKNEKD